MPEIRGRISRDEYKAGHFTDAPEGLEFVNSNALDTLAPLGTSCPDHFLRTKIRPLIVQADADAAMLDRLCGQAGLEGGFAALKAQGTVELFAEPLLQFADGEFPTPSGKIELASARAEEMGLPRIPLPHADPRPVAGHLRLLSPASAWAMNTSYGNDPRNETRIEAEGVTLHPADAAGRGLAEGAMARLANESGEMLLPVHVDAKAPPGVALAVKGAWPKLQGGRNINVLHAARKADMGESTSVHGVEVTVTAAG